MKKLLTIAATSFLLLLCLIPLGGYGGYAIKFSASTITYCALTYYWLTKNSDTDRVNMTSMIALPVILLYLPVHIIYFADTKAPMLSSVAPFLGILVGFLLVRATAAVRIMLLSLLFTSSFWVTAVGYEFWFNKALFGTFTGRINEPMPPFTLRTDDGRLLTSASMKGQVVVLDFWNTGCGACFEKFPQLETYYTRYKHSSKIKFIAVNRSLSRDTKGQATALIKKQGYTFPVLYAETLLVDSVFKVDVYPTVLVMDSSQRIIYRGNLNGIGNLLAKAEKTDRRK